MIGRGSEISALLHKDKVRSNSEVWYNDGVGELLETEDEEYIQVEFDANVSSTSIKTRPSPVREEGEDYVINTDTPPPRKHVQFDINNDNIVVDSFKLSRKECKEIFENYEVESNMGEICEAADKVGIPHKRNIAVRFL